MNRHDFSRRFCEFFLEVTAAGERPLIDFCKRSDEEQARLFAEGLSRCDGKVNISNHQRGKAIDIYFLNDEGDGLEDPILGWDYWHQVWQDKYDGKPMVRWMREDGSIVKDEGHFE